MFSYIRAWYRKCQDRAVETKRILRNKRFLESCLHRQYGSLCEERARRNNQYLIDNLARQNAACERLRDMVATQKLMFERLRSLPHSYRKAGWFDTYPYTENPENIYQLTPRQLIRVYLLLEALQKESFRQHIGTLLEDDFQDPYAEHGGLVVIAGSGEIKLINVEGSHAKERNPLKNTTYKIPFDALKQPHIAQYHFHATQNDCSEYAGPSQGIILLDPADLSSCDAEIIREGESHHVVITKLLGRMFNIDYYGGEEIGDRKRRITVVDLGNYQY